MYIDLRDLFTMFNIVSGRITGVKEGQGGGYKPLSCFCGPSNTMDFLGYGAAKRSPKSIK